MDLLAYYDFRTAIKTSLEFSLPVIVILITEGITLRALIH